MHLRPAPLPLTLPLHLPYLSTLSGIGPNMQLAKLATNQAKPNGQFRLTAAQAVPYLEPLSVSKLPGIGWAMADRLRGMEIHTVGHVRAKTCGFFQAELGEKLGREGRGRVGGLGLTGATICYERCIGKAGRGLLCFLHVSVAVAALVLP